MSQDVTLCAATHDVEDPNFQLITSPIEIGKRPWIAAEAFVGPGVTIGDDSVIGARAVLFKNTEPGFIYAGNPAKSIRKRKVTFGQGDA